MQPLYDDSVYQLISYDGRWSVRLYDGDPCMPGIHAMGPLSGYLDVQLLATVRRSAVEEERAYSHARTQFSARLSALRHAIIDNTAFREVASEVWQVLTYEYRYVKFEVQHLYTTFATLSTVDEGKISIPKNIDGIVNPAHRLRLSFAKWFARILTHYKAHAPVEDLEILDKLTPQLLNKLNVLWSRTAVNYKIELIKGDDILDAYYSGTPSSCMAYAHHPGVLFYAKNPVEMAVVRNINDEITGRALVWTTTTGEKFMDRAYPNNDGLEWYALQHWAKSNVQYYRTRNGNVARTVDDESCDIVVKMRKYPFLPYLDTLTAYRDDPAMDGYMLLTNGTSIDLETTLPTPRIRHGMWDEGLDCKCDEPWLSCYVYTLDGKPLAVEELRELSPNDLARVDSILFCRADEVDEEMGEDRVYCRDASSYEWPENVYTCARCSGYFAHYRSMATVQLGRGQEAGWCYSCREVMAVELDGQWWALGLVEECTNCFAWVKRDELTDTSSTTPVDEYRCKDCLTDKDANNDTTETPSIVQAEPAEPEYTPPDPVQYTLVPGAGVLWEPIDGARLDKAIDSAPAYPHGSIFEGPTLARSPRRSFFGALHREHASEAPLSVEIRIWDDSEPSGVLRSS